MTHGSRVPTHEVGDNSGEAVEFEGRKIRWKRSMYGYIRTILARQGYYETKKHQGTARKNTGQGYLWWFIPGHEPRDFFQSMEKQRWAMPLNVIFYRMMQTLRKKRRKDY